MAGAPPTSPRSHFPPSPPRALPTPRRRRNRALRGSLRFPSIPQPPRAGAPRKPPGARTAEGRRPGHRRGGRAERAARTAVSRTVNGAAEKWGRRFAPDTGARGKPAILASAARCRRPPSARASGRERGRDAAEAARGSHLRIAASCRAGPRRPARPANSSASGPAIFPAIFVVGGSIPAPAPRRPGEPPSRYPGAAARGFRPSTATSGRSMPSVAARRGPA